MKTVQTQNRTRTDRNSLTWRTGNIFGICGMVAVLIVVLFPAKLYNIFAQLSFETARFPSHSTEPGFHIDSITRQIYFNAFEPTVTKYRCYETLPNGAIRAERRFRRDGAHLETTFTADGTAWIIRGYTGRKSGLMELLVLRSQRPSPDRVAQGSLSRARGAVYGDSLRALEDASLPQKGVFAVRFPIFGDQRLGDRQFDGVVTGWNYFAVVPSAASLDYPIHWTVWRGEEPPLVHQILLDPKQEVPDLQTGNHVWEIRKIDHPNSKTVWNAKLTVPGGSQMYYKAELTPALQPAP